MVTDLENRGLLKLTQGRGTEVYTAGEVVRHLKRVAEVKSGIDSKMCFDSCFCILYSFPPILSSFL
jgi:hypothetical protein